MLLKLISTEVVANYINSTNTASGMSVGVKWLRYNISTQMLIVSKMGTQEKRLQMSKEHMN